MSGPAEEQAANPAARFAPRPVRPSDDGPAATGGAAEPASSFAAESPDRTELGLEFRWGDGRLMTADYMHLVSTRLDTSGVAVIEFSRFRFRLGGRNLAPLLRRVKDHRQAVIEEIPAEHDFPEHRGWSVYRITLEEDPD